MTKITKADLYDLRTKSIEDVAAIISLTKSHEKILEVGCGTGRILLALFEKGYKNICGVEIDDIFYKKALSKLDGRQIRIYHTDFLDFDESEKYDKVLFTFNVFTEYLSIAQKLAALEKAKQLMADSGKIILSNLAHDFKGWSSKEITHNFDINDQWNCQIDCDRNLLHQTSACSVVYTNKHSKESFHDHYKVSLITRNELLAMFRLLRLKVTGEYGSYSLDDISKTSDIMIHVLESLK